MTSRSTLLQYHFGSLLPATFKTDHRRAIDRRVRGARGSARSSVLESSRGVPGPHGQHRLRADAASTAIGGPALRTQSMKRRRAAALYAKAGCGRPGVAAAGATPAT